MSRIHFGTSESVLHTPKSGDVYFEAQKATLHNPDASCVPHGKALEREKGGENSGRRCAARPKSSDAD